MASTDLKTFIEDRLRSLDPTVDLSAGSPAETQLVEPILNYLGTDPFETDIQTFILDRFAQEFPDIFAGDPGVVSDTLIKPLILLLEPFKRETQLIKNNQSLKDSSVLSDDAADALVANFFETRSTGGYSKGTVRVYFANPVNVTCEITTRFFTSSGLNFYPSNPISISAEEMVFNRDGSLYFMDVAVQAETVGQNYNIDAGLISGVNGIFGPVKVTNLGKFSSGTSSIDTPTFVASARQALNERSMVTRRGATARLNDVFQTTVKAVQVIGAGDPEMQRDLLVADSPGHAWITGLVTFYKNIAIVQCRTIDDPTGVAAPVQGDTLYFYVDKYSAMGTWSTLDQKKRFVRLRVEEVLAGPMNMSSGGFQLAYFVRFSDPDGVLAGIPSITTSIAQSFEGGFSKKGTVHISSLPSVGSTDLTVNNQEVHMLGHSDIYARPVLQDTSTVVLSSLVDDPGTKYFTIQRQTLQSYGAVAGEENKVTDTINFIDEGVAPGDVVIIETGNDAGSYTVGSVSSGALYLSSRLTTNATNLRYRVVKGLHINPFSPKIPRVPFGSNPSNDLQTNIGSNAFAFSGVSTDLVSFGVKIGDTIRVLSGVDAGDFTITGITDGKNITVDRPAGGTNSGLSYEIFLAMEGVNLPLVRIKQMLVLDSSKQSTGVEVPYAEPVAVIPTCDFTTAMVRASSILRSGVVVPQIDDGVNPFVSGGNVAATQVAAKRYSNGVDPANGGTYKAVVSANGGATEAELLFPLDASSDGCSYFIAAAEDTNLPVNRPPIDPKVGDVLTLKKGPNKGSYLIKDVLKFKYYVASGNECWVYFVKIYGQFPVDILRQIVQFCDGAPGGTAVVDKVDGSQTYPLAFPGFFTGIYNTLGNKLHMALTAYGAASPGTTALQEAIDEVCLTDYEWGDPARGVLRSYFAQPVLFQQNTALSENPTTYSFKTSNGEILKFRANPNLYTQQQIVPPRLDSDTPVLEYPRDATASGTTVSFSSASRTTMFQLGVKVGDILSMYPEFFFHGSTGTAGTGTDIQTAVSTVAGSNVVTAPSASSSPFTSSMAGGLFFIDEGADAGAYSITGVPDGQTLQLDRPLTVTTPTILAQGNAASWGYDAVNDKLTASSGTPFSGMTGKYVTLYGIDARYQGSYAISGTAAGGATALLSRPTAIGHFPAYPVTATARWVLTDAPVTAPTKTALGTELYGLTPIRVYDSIPLEYEITSVPTAIPVSPPSTLIVDSAPTLGVAQPFRIYRPNVRRVTPKEMSEKQDGPLYYFDTEAVSLGCQSSFNLKKWESYLTADEGSYDSLGYRFIVDDNTLTYSVKETGTLVLPNRILPVSSEDSLDNMLNLVGIPLQISYEYGDVIQQIQQFISSAEDRVTAANMLARHFLPTYVSYDATYSGGSAPSVIAADIISYINNLAIETPVDVSVIEGYISKRGGNVVAPTKVIVDIHDWDRKRWVEFGQDQVGGLTTKVPYNGSARISFFISGSDASGQTTPPEGERILLTQS